jgi:HEPN domain-containing protein
MEEKAWIKKARKDLEASKSSFDSGHYEWSCFQSQQAAEKALKAVYIKKYKKLLKVHDLVLLAKKVSAPKELLQFCRELTLAYEYSRYPAEGKVNNFDEKASKFLNYAAEILRWAEKNI